ncbi:hypothetical protein PFUM301598_15490 [Pseudomonas fluorescens]
MDWQGKLELYRQLGCTLERYVGCELIVGGGASYASGSLSVRFRASLNRQPPTDAEPKLTTHIRGGIVQGQEMYRSPGNP